MNVYVDETETPKKDPLALMYNNNKRIFICKKKDLTERNEEDTIPTCRIGSYKTSNAQDRKN